MNVDFTPEQEAQLSQIAARAGMDTEHLVKDAVLRLLEENAKLRLSVRRAIEEADQGELIDHQEVVAHIEQRFQSR
jgi:predicted transcriptional regulator